MFQRIFFWPLFTLLMGFALGSTVVWAIYHGKTEHAITYQQHVKQESKQYPDKWHKTFLEHTPDWFVALFTLVLSIVTGLLVRSTNRLWKAGERQIAVAQKSADAAMLSAQAAIAMELPLIRMKPDKIGSSDVTLDGKMTVYWDLNFVTIVNVGRTRAIPIEIQWGWTLNQKLPNEPVYPSKTGFRVDNVFETDKPQTKTLPECKVEISQGKSTQIESGQLRLWFYVNFVYEDFMGKPHQTALCWHWTNVGGGYAWRPEDARTYNRKT